MGISLRPINNTIPLDCTRDNIYVPHEYVTNPLGSRSGNRPEIGYVEANYESVKDGCCVLGNDH